MSRGAPRNTAIEPASESIRGTAFQMFYVARVRRLFPDWAAEVTRLALRNPMFRSLCDDYGSAAEALDHLKMHSDAKDVEKVQEYRSLTQDLEKELKYELLAARPHDDPP